MELRRSHSSRHPDTTVEPSAAQHPVEGQRLRIVPPGDGSDLAAPHGELPVDLVSDVALIAALVAGEADALGGLYDRHAHIVFSLLVRIVGDRDTGEELLQEVFLRAWQQAHTFDETRGTVRVWLHSIAHGLALNELRRRRRRPQVQEKSINADPNADDYAGCAEPGLDPAVDVSSADRDARLVQALDQLPAAQRAVLTLFAVGFSQSEIAVILGEPLGTVKSRMRRALCHLREILPGLGIDAGWRSD